MLSTANIQTIFEKCKKKKLFCVYSKDICGFIWIYEQLSVILSLLYNIKHTIMKVLLFSFLVIFVFSGCNKSYKYVEIVKEKSVLSNSYEQKEKEAKNIIAKNDSIAYLEAYKKFLISLKVSKEMKAAGMEFASIPIRFSLYDDKGKEVKVYVDNKILDEIERKISSLGSGIKETFPNNSQKVQNPIDSIKIKELTPLFSFKKDEFDPRGLTWIVPKSAPKYTNQNGIYCYFQKDVDGVSNFRIRIQYYAEDWLFIRKYQFSIDGEAYEFIPNNVETDHDSNVWEWCDEKLTISNIEIVKALSTSKNAKIKFVGRQYHDIRTITKREIEGIKDALDLYVAMGGIL